MTMRILYVTGEFPPMRGSVGDHTARLATAVAAQGHDVAVLTDARAVGGPLPGVARLAEQRHWGPGAWRSVAAHARGYDVLHLEYQAGAFGMGLAVQFGADVVRLLAGTPVVTTFHDLLVPYLFPKAGALRAWAVRHLARSADGVIATNGEDAATLRGWGVRRLAEIPIASPLPLEPGAAWDRAAWRARWGVEAGQKLIVHYGFLNRAKGVESLLRAYDGLLRAGQPFKLLLAGDPLGASDPSNAAYLAELEALAGALNLHAPWLQWTGDLGEAELIQAILGADLIVLPFREGASLRRSTLVMALSLGQPVVTTQPRSPIPILQDGHNVALVPPGDSAALARQMALLLRYEPTLERLARGAASLRGHFDWSAIAAQSIALYEAVARRG